MKDTAKYRRLISAIVPARNEEAVIAECVGSLVQQQEIAEILVIDDQSQDRTAEIVRELTKKYARVRLIESAQLPFGWVGKNHAVSLGAREAKGGWLLFTDADVLHEKKSGAKALALARQHNVSLVSFSPTQITEAWYEKALIPVVFCRLGRKFSFDDINNPESSAAAANGQFLMISREAYEAVGGHVAIAGEVLEDVALARRVKEAGFPIWFSSGIGIVSVRMYRSFGQMWQGWKKNLYRLMGADFPSIATEIALALLPLLLLAALVSGAWWSRHDWHLGVLTALTSLGIWLWLYGRELKRNQFVSGLIWYGIPGKLLYAALLLASYLSHRKGVLAWKGREYPVGTSAASKR
ncbi:MAG TPA: glycosyltransferase [Candidatus Acidoferrum sp.]|nr:glycosyltransferase [Candidatus Acidoferrum sp.]